MNVALCVHCWEKTGRDVSLRTCGEAWNTHRKKGAERCLTAYARVFHIKFLLSLTEFQQQSRNMWGLGSKYCKD